MRTTVKNVPYLGGEVIVVHPDNCRCKEIKPMEEMIPLSANIFHAKGDHRARAVAAIDIVLACLPMVFENPNKRDIASNVAIELQSMLMPAGYDVRGELGAALRGEDTAAPREASDGNGPG